MRDYSSGDWGFGFLWSLRASVFPRAFVLAFPNAVIAYVLSDSFQPNPEPDQEKLAFSLWAGFTGVLGFLLFFRSNVAYSRWWEGGTLLQQVRGEWFNAYSSLIAFSTADPAKQDAVDEFQHLLGRLMSLLLCSALQQVSPKQQGKSFEIIGCDGIAPQSLKFLKKSSDKVEVIIQWIQRSTVLHMQSGVLDVPPPVISRVFQELSRGIVNLQNARKIAEFPFPFPYAQTSVVMLIIHWFMCPVLSGLMLGKYLAAGTSFTIVFFFWCVNYIALQLEMPYGDRENDLPLDQMQQDWNRSLCTLLAKPAQCPPKFEFDWEIHCDLRFMMSDGLCCQDSARLSQCIAAASPKEVKEVKEVESHKDLPPHACDSRTSAGRASVAAKQQLAARAPDLLQPPAPRRGPAPFEPPRRAPEPGPREVSPEALAPGPTEGSRRAVAPAQLGKTTSGGHAPSRPSGPKWQEPPDGGQDDKLFDGGQDAGEASALEDGRRASSGNEASSSSSPPPRQGQGDALAWRPARPAHSSCTSDAGTHSSRAASEHLPPWTLDAGGAGRGGAARGGQCSAGCLTAFGRLRCPGVKAGHL